jgi:hypothetical protein
MSTADFPSDNELGRQIARALRDLPDVPAPLERTAIALFDRVAPSSALQDVARALWHHVAAVLSFDSWAAPGFAHGMRSLRAPTRHLLFTAEGRDIDLRIAPMPEAAYALTGQVLGPDETGQVELQRVGADAGVGRQTALDPLGEFRIDDLVRGVYLITLQVGGERIVLPPLEVGEPTP